MGGANEVLRYGDPDWLVVTGKLLLIHHAKHNFRIVYFRKNTSAGLITVVGEAHWKCINRNYHDTFFAKKNRAESGLHATCEYKKKGIQFFKYNSCYICTVSLLISMLEKANYLKEKNVAYFHQIVSQQIIAHP